MADAERGREFLDQHAAGKPALVAPGGLRSQLVDLHRRGMPPGDRTGWPSVDRHYTVLPGQVTIITGWPGSGKSEWMDALAVNLARQNWKIAFFSPENHPLEFHASKFLEKVAGKPFGAGPTERLTEEELGEYLDEIDQWFEFISAPDGVCPNMRSVIEVATPWLKKHTESKRALVIDPWNELEHWRPSGISETEYVSQQLSFARNWARAANVHLFVVAHPQKTRRENGLLPVPTMDLISGSQHWWNKADCGITVWRDPAQPDAPEVQIHVQKVRFKHIGRPGMVTLLYDRVTGRYRENVIAWNELPNAKNRA